MKMKTILFLCCVALVFVKEINSQELQNSVVIQEDILRLNCFKTLSLDNSKDFKIFDERKIVKEVILEACGPPSNSYADILTTINVNFPDIKRLVILNPQLTEDHNSSSGPDPKRPQHQHFTNLQLEELEIKNEVESPRFAVDLNFLTNLNYLRRLSFNNIEIWGPFPDATKIQTMDFTNGIFHGNIGGCSRLKVLHVNNIQLIDVQEHWLENCIKLDTLNLVHVSPDTSNKILSRLSYAVQNITVQYCSLERIPDGIDLIRRKDLRLNNVNLRHLDLSHNNIDFIPRYSTFSGLETLDLSYNKLKYFDKYELYSNRAHPKLLELKLDGNNFEDICKINNFLPYNKQTRDDDMSHRKALETPLRRLSLSGTSLPYLCFGKYLVPQLEFLNVTHNKLTELNYRLFYWVAGDHFEVDMRHNPLKEVVFTKEDYTSMKRNDPAVTRWSKVTVLTNAMLPCDCSLAWFARALRERLLTVEGLQCENGSSIEDPNVFSSC